MMMFKMNLNNDMNEKRSMRFLYNFQSKSPTFKQYLDEIATLNDCCRIDLTFKKKKIILINSQRLRN